MKSEILKLERFVRHAWSKRWWLLGIQVLAAVAATIVFYALPPKYRSATTIRVAPDSVINPLTQGLAVSSRMEDLAGTLRQEILSRNHLEGVIVRLGIEDPEADPAIHEARIRSMANNIDVEVRGSSRRGQNLIFHIAYTGFDPYEVRDITNALSTLFIEKNLETRKSESNVAYEFIRQQLMVYRQKLEESENALRRFEEQHMDEMPETKAANLARLEAYKASLEEVRRDISLAKVQKDLLIKRIPEQAAAVPGGETVVPNPLNETLREREEELANLRRTYSDKYPDVVSLQAEITAIRAEIERTPTVPASEARLSGPTPVQTTVIDQLQQIDVELQSLVSRVPKLEREIKKYEGKVRSLPEQEQELAQLRRDYDVDSSIYEMFLRRLEEARVSRELELAKKGDVFRIIDAAALPATPFSPLRKMFLLYGFAGGLALNLALVYWFWANDTSVRNARETEEYLGVGIMAMIPRMISGREKVSQVIGGTLFAALCAVLAVLYAVGFYWSEVFEMIGNVLVLLGK